MVTEVKQIYCSALLDEDVAPADVVVTLMNGDRYVASFIPYNCIPRLLQTHADGSAYFWSKYMVLVNDCHPDTIDQVVRSMVEEGELREVFGRI